MPKRINELSAKQVRDLSVIGYHSVGGVAGLKLQIASETARSWILRTTVGSKRSEIGLGSFPEVTLSMARDKARELKEQIRNGIDPLEQKKAARLKLIREKNRSATFGQLASDAFKVKQQEFRNSKHADQWINTLITYAFPIIGKMPVDEIEAADVLKVLEPIWSSKTETASRLRQRMASVFDHATASGLRTKPNPAAWKGCLQPLLPSPEKLKKRQGRANNHHPALPISDMHRFMLELRQRTGDGARALEFAILAAARSGEVIGARWDEVDLKERVWHLTAERMKADKPHTVPLSDAAVTLLQAMPRNGQLIFQTPKGGELSNGAMLATVKRMHNDDLEKGGRGFKDPSADRIATPHGFRSTFKDWSRKNGRYPDEWSELALAHVNSDATRSAYARDELLDDRAILMQDWANFCEGDKVGNVVSLRVQR